MEACDALDQSKWTICRLYIKKIKNKQDALAINDEQEDIDLL